MVVDDTELMPKFYTISSEDCLVNAMKRNAVMMQRYGK